MQTTITGQFDSAKPYLAVRISEDGRHLLEARNMDVLSTERLAFINGTAYIGNTEVPALVIDTRKTKVVPPYITLD